MTKLRSSDEAPRQRVQQVRAPVAVQGPQTPPPTRPASPASGLLQLLLRAKLRGPSTALLPAVGRPRVHPRVALPANQLVLVVLPRQNLQGRLDDASAQPQHQMQGRLLLDVVVSQGASILELLSGEDETLLIRRDAFFILDLGLDILDRVRGLHLEGDRLSRQGLDENLHRAFYTTSKKRACE